MMKLSSGLRYGLLVTSCWRTLLANCVIGLFSSTQPDDADDAENATLLGLVTLDGGAFVGGVATNGLNFDATPVHDVLYTKTTLIKPVAATWKCVALANGTIGWARVYANAYTTGASTTAVRFDVTAAVSGGQMTISSSQAVAGVPISVDAANIIINAYRR